MTLEEYNRVKDMTYLEYCDYLQNKYGIGRADFFTSSFRKNQKVTRTKEGLIAHHKMEYRVANLSQADIAAFCPFEWQKKENIIYCDYLEHLFLHVLICKYPEPVEEMNGLENARVGYGGVIMLTAELNDLFSGWQTAQTWRKACHDRVCDDKAVYMAILRQLLEIVRDKGGGFDKSMLMESLNASFGTWDLENNRAINNEILALM